MSKTINFTDLDISRERLRQAVPHMQHIIPKDAYFVVRDNEDSGLERDVTRWVPQNASGWHITGYLNHRHVHAFENSMDATHFRLQF